MTNCARTEESDSLASVPVKEKQIVRDLAEQVYAAACRDEMPAIRQRWCDVNALRKPDRAPVWFKPVGCWSELLPDDQLHIRFRQAGNQGLIYICQLLIGFGIVSICGFYLTDDLGKNCL